MFVGTFEGAVGACMFVLVHLNKNGYFKGISRANNINVALLYFVKGVVVFSVVID